MAQHTGQPPKRTGWKGEGSHFRAVQFFITLNNTPWLDGKHVVFGEVRHTPHRSCFLTQKIGGPIADQILCEALYMTSSHSLRGKYISAWLFFFPVNHPTFMLKEAGKKTGMLGEE